MVFKGLALNHDDRAKKHAFLMDPAGHWTVAPSYDLTFPHGPGGERYLAINGEDKNVSITAIRAVYGNHGISPAIAAEIIEQVSSAVGGFRDYASEYGVSRATMKEVGARWTHS